MSLAIALVILVGTGVLLRDAVHLAIGGVPKGIEPAQVRDFLGSLPGVEGVHDMHVWALSTTEAALTAHLVKPQPEDDDMLLAHATRELRERFDIEHVTIQWERWEGGRLNGTPCDLGCSSGDRE